MGITGIIIPPHYTRTLRMPQVLRQLKVSMAKGVSFEHIPWIPGQFALNAS
jgi:hypothetical protein